MTRLYASRLSSPDTDRSALPPPSKQGRYDSPGLAPTLSLVVGCPGASVMSLPDDILLLIISFVGVNDIVALRMTSKRFAAVSNLRWVWSDALKRHVIDRNIPIPGYPGDLKSLSSKDLEIRALHATRFQENWCSNRPRTKRCFQFNVDDSDDADANAAGASLTREHPAPVSHVLFVPGSNGELIITVSGTSCITCWEVPLSGSESFIVAESKMPKNHIIDGIAVNTDPKSEGLLAVTWIVPSPTTTGAIQSGTIEMWMLDRFHGRFVTINSRQSPHRFSPLHGLHGDWLILADPVANWHWRKGLFYVLNWGNIHQSPAPDGVLCTKFVRGYLLIIRQSHIHLLPLHHLLHPDSKTKPQPELMTGAYLHMPGVGDAAVIVEHKLSEAEEAEWMFNPVSILMRISEGGFDVIRKYDLIPRPVLPDSEREGSGDDAGGAALAQTPCNFMPSQTWPVAPSCTNLIVGENGKGLWTETRNITTSQSTYPARCMIGFDLNAELVRPPPATTGGKNEHPSRGYWKFNFVVREREMYAARVGMGEVARRQYRITTSALEDTVGRIALGSRDGKVEVVDLV
ncbi:hypothetical protein EVG20_g7773 [Dentipellis fragilis]|uniref:F-box domain-containing protein n=1 Tax=Dentipellis fragilis TaxID=205917 RepID=A0A4Y9YCA0_9AGAM|nr:hypothetical protein EVG20_g7773 [Dentipellis fragilis]